MKRKFIIILIISTTILITSLEYFNKISFNFKNEETEKYDSICTRISTKYCKCPNQDLKYLTHSYLLNKRWVQYSTVYSIKTEKIESSLKSCKDFKKLSDYKKANNLKHKDILEFELKNKNIKNILYDEYDIEKKIVLNFYDTENNLYYTVVRIME